MQDIRKKRRALMSEADALFDLLETERAVLADYAATLCEGGPHMLGDELVRLFLEASEDARAVAAELALRAAPRPRARRRRRGGRARLSPHRQGRLRAVGCAQIAHIFAPARARYAATLWGVAPPPRGKLFKIFAFFVIFERFAIQMVQNVIY